MKTVVLDDDPTGTQSAAGVTVLLHYDADTIRNALAHEDSIYVQTNSRAVDALTAVQIVRGIRDATAAAAAELGTDVQFVLRGDSTLRGHVFAETEQFMSADAVMVFCPAFPDGGRITRDGVHLVRIDGEFVPAHDTEYAADPVFPFESGVLSEYVREKSVRVPLPVSRADVRAGAVATAVLRAPAGAVLLPDAETDADIALIAEGITRARAEGRVVVVRSAAPLAAALADVQSVGLLPRPIVPAPAPTLLACGSHTAGATAQLAAVEAKYGPAVIISTDAAFADATAAGRDAAERARRRIAETGFAAIATERHRRAEHNTLRHGELVMTALTTAVETLVPDVAVVVAKGGITSAELARTAIGADTARVRGQVLPGVSVWDLHSRTGDPRTYVVVPGNVGDASAITDVLEAVGR